ncbi:hypothetical protein [Labedaea rhizosphaerae]|uniref:Lipoprotein n=1 Tax=Labedaea rhizosphaerae TaxID=598644 RepID=A0A4R6SDG3_LABRH|nr:hypothetical protein [Labedaea rhizosphaerae]TDP97146.1 hypothetical protein EV186_103107 [Labedaea rhizosphaerae]
MRTALVTAMFTAAVAAALLSGCSGGDDTAAKTPTTTTATSTPAASSSASAPSSSAGGSTDAAGNTKQVCATAEKSLDLVAQDKMKTDVIAEAKSNGGDAQKAAVTVFKRNMGKIATTFTAQGKIATDTELGDALTVTATALTKALGEIKTVGDLDKLDNSAVLNSTEVKNAGQTLTDKCGGKFSDGF